MSWSVIRYHERRCISGPKSSKTGSQLTEAAYKSARRVFWIVDNGSSHRGKRSVELQSQWPALRLVHTPVHAS